MNPVLVMSKITKLNMKSNQTTDGRKFFLKGFYLLQIENLYFVVHFLEDLGKNQ